MPGTCPQTGHSGHAPEDCPNRASDTVTYTVTMTATATWKRSDCESTGEWQELRQRVLDYSADDVLDTIFGDVCARGNEGIVQALWDSTTDINVRRT